jgi:hypothetical protein
MQANFFSVLMIALFFATHAAGEHHQAALALKQRTDHFNRQLSDLEAHDRNSRFKMILGDLTRAVTEVDTDASRICEHISSLHDEHGRVAHEHREKHKLNTHLLQNAERSNHHDKYRRLAEHHAGQLHLVEQQFHTVGAARSVCEDVLLALDDMKGRLAVLAGEQVSDDEL